MSELIFGVICLIAVVPMSLPFILAQPSMIIFFSIFYIVGICLVVKGAKRVKKDNDTDKKGEICYGRIIDIVPTGVYVNDRQEYKAVVHFYIPSLNKDEILEEVIGFEYYKYNVGDYYKLKYYNKDINFVNKVEISEVPQNVLNFSDNISMNNIVYQSNERLQPMDMPVNGSTYAWDNNENNKGV